MPVRKLTNKAVEPPPALERVHDRHDPLKTNRSRLDGCRSQSPFSHVNDPVPDALIHAAIEEGDGADVDASGSEKGDKAARGGAQRVDRCWTPMRSSACSRPAATG